MLIIRNAEGVHDQREVGNPCARRSIKGSKDGDDRLVSNKILSQINGSLDWRLGPNKIGQKFKNMPSL